METELVYASHVDEEDFLVYGGDVYQVTSIDDEGDTLAFDARDEDGEPAELPKFAPFDVIEVVLTFEEPFEFEDVPIEDDEDDEE